MTATSIFLLVFSHFDLVDLMTMDSVNILIRFLFPVLQFKMAYENPYDQQAPLKAKFECLLFGK